MAKIRVEILLALDAEIWINHNCLKKAIHFKREGLEAELGLPPFDNTDPSSLIYGKFRFDGFTGLASTKAGSNNPPDRLAINKILVTVREEVNGISKAAMSGSDAANISRLVIDHQRNCLRFAEDVATLFLDWLRLKGQTWLGPMGKLVFSGPPDIQTYEEETGYRFPASFGGTIRGRMTNESNDLDISLFTGISELFSKADKLPLPESFLSDAEHFLLLGTPHDLQRSVLLAAIACEIKVKAILRALARPDARALVDVLISNPRDFSMSAAGLFDLAMKASVGASLREDNKNVYKALSDEGGLFPTRNKIAHSGFVLTPKQARHCVDAARNAFFWLDNLAARQT